MAPTSPDASEIRRRGRQRLIGAVAIALLLIVFVPMLLDSEPRRSRDEPKLDIPSKDNAPPLPAPPPAPPPVAETKVVPTPPPKVAVVEPKVEAKAPAKDGFVVQVGAFADDGHLQQVKGKLALANIVTYTEPAGSLKRLRVGPFPSRDAAEKSAAEVRKVVPDAKVVPQ